jgi:hypothetical protein
MPLSMPAIDPIKPRHRASIDLSPEGQHRTRVCAELDMVPIHPPLNLSRLVRSLETPCDDASILRDLNRLQRTPCAVDIVGVNRPVTRNIRWRLLCRRHRAQDAHKKSNTKYNPLRSMTTHHVLLRIMKLGRRASLLKCPLQLFQSSVRIQVAVDVLQH